MKIVVLNLTGGGMSGGYKKYLLNIIPRLAADINTDSLLCVSPEPLHVDKWFEPMRNVEFAICPPFRPFISGLNKKLRQRLEQFSPDVIFIPMERPVKFQDIPVVAMVRNMEPLVGHIDRYSLEEKMRRVLQYKTAKMAVENASRVIAVSQFVRDFLINTWHISGDKIGLVYHGLSPDKNIVSTRPKDVPFEWGGKFIFTAGSIRPARGLEDLILAAKDIILNSPGMRGIVIAGKAPADMPKYTQQLLKLIKSNNVIPYFIFTDEIGPAQMKWCYENCRLFVTTSRVESFGIAGLEAMSHGCLCIAADNPCLPEIFKDCAVYYRPKDAAGLACAINSVLKRGEVEKTEMSRKARQRAEEFSWEKTTEGLIKELKYVIEKNFNYR